MCVEYKGIILLIRKVISLITWRQIVQVNLIKLPVCVCFYIPFYSLYRFVGVFAHCQPVEIRRSLTLTLLPASPANWSRNADGPPALSLIPPMCRGRPLTPADNVKHSLT